MLWVGAPTQRYTYMYTSRLNFVLVVRSVRLSPHLSKTRISFIVVPCNFWQYTHSAAINVLAERGLVALLWNYLRETWTETDVNWSRLQLLMGFGYEYKQMPSRFEECIASPSMGFLGKLGLSFTYAHPCIPTFLSNVPTFFFIIIFFKPVLIIVFGFDYTSINPLSLYIIILRTG